MQIELENKIAENLRILIKRYKEAKDDPTTSKEKLLRNTKELADTASSALSSKL